MRNAGAPLLHFAFCTSMRVITGLAKGHKLQAPKGMSTRPMLDRVKESLFSVLEGYRPIRGRVLDLYAGTGQLGIECLSRGAASADFVEQSAHVCKIIADNLRHTKFADQARVHQIAVERFLHNYRGPDTYAFIVMDPPYADPQIEQTLRSIGSMAISAEDGLVIVGHSQRVPLADAYPGLERVKLRRIGDSCFSIYERASMQPEVSA
jgi:16S rRNA (guanine966-N2)-methyltransferase